MDKSLMKRIDLRIARSDFNFSFYNYVYSRWRVTEKSAQRVFIVIANIR